jgi:hypothetical protein
MRTTIPARGPPCLRVSEADGIHGAVRLAPGRLLWHSVRMRRAIVLAFLAATASAGLPGNAVADCKCAANGTRYEMGAIVCVRSPAGAWLGRCGKVLNNSSWEKLTDGCPVTLDAASPPRPMSRPLSAPAATIAIRPDRG